MSSHRPVYLYEKVDSIPTEMHPGQQLLELYLNDLRARWTANARVRSPTFQIKQALISLATFGFGNEVVEENQEAQRTFNGFQRALLRVLPPSLGFERIEVRVPDVVFVTRTGTFAIDAVSGGVAALIDITWQIFLRSELDEEFTVIIDEPENHLHPELQRSIMPNLLDAFPKVQFIVATHNPFIVSAVRDSDVYALRHDEDGHVTSHQLDLRDRTGNSSAILREA